MSTIECLSMGGEVPSWIEKNNVMGVGEVEANTTGGEGGEQDTPIGLKLLYDVGSVCGISEEGESVGEGFFESKKRLFEIGEDYNITGKLLNVIEFVGVGRGKCAEFGDGS